MGDPETGWNWSSWSDALLFLTGHSSSNPEQQPLSTTSQDHASSSQGPAFKKRKISAPTKFASVFGDEPPCKINEEVYEIHKPATEPDLEIVFFHGFELGDYKDSYWTDWLSADQTQCWLKTWLVEDFPRARVLSVSYDSSLKQTSTSGRMDLHTVAENLQYSLITDAQVGQHNCPVVLVGHSLGGLVAKTFCVRVVQQHASCALDTDKGELGNFLANLKGICFYATPHSGSVLSERSKHSLTGPLVQDLKVLDKHIARLSESFSTLCNGRRWQVCGLGEQHETKLGRFRGIVVEEASARHGMGNNYRTVAADHIGICKPEGKNRSNYSFLRDFLSRILKKEMEKLDDIRRFCNEKITVGLETRVADIQTILQTVPTLGLYGMGGVGKSTLARAVLDASIRHFEFTCFIADIKELVKSKETGDPEHLKNRMLEGLRRVGSKLPKDDVDWSTLKGRKVMLVLDDVDSEHQLEQIPWKTGEWFHPDSKVIATSRHEGFCNQRFKKTYNVECLNEADSSKLFLLHAFDGDEVPTYLRSTYLDQILHFCGGVPLALEVVAKAVYKETDEEMWAGAIEKLKEGESMGGDYDDLRLLNSLKLSYDTLTVEEQKMFLDAALLFTSVRVIEALEIWKGCWGLAVSMDWRNLKWKCLVKEDEMGRVWIHETLRMLAQNIGCPKHKSKQKWLRVGSPDEAVEILTSTSEVPAKVEGLIYSRRQNQPLILESRMLTEAKLPNLRILKMTGIEILGDGLDLPRSLVYLNWSYTTHIKCPFSMKNLKHLSILTMKGWRALKMLPEDLENLSSLTRLELEGCESLTKLPKNISKLTKLTHMGLTNTGLTELPESLGELTNLETLKLQRTHLSRLPTSIGSLKKLKVLTLENTGVTEVPESIAGLLNLETLNLQQTQISHLPALMGRHLKNLQLSDTCLTKIPNSICNLPSLTSMNLSGTSVNILPEAFGNLGGLETLKLSRTGLISLPSSFGKLHRLINLYLDSNPLQNLPESFGELRRLKRLELTSTMVEKLPQSFVQLQLLEDLTMTDCRRLTSLPEGFAGLQRLSNLDVKGGNSLLNIPTAAADLPSLEVLHLDYYDSPWRMYSSSNDSKDRAGQEDEDTEIAVGPCKYFETSSMLSSQFSELKKIIIEDHESVSEFPQHLLHSLKHMNSLRTLSLLKFDGVKSLSTDFWSCLPKQLSTLNLEGWRRLEELSESLGQQFTQLQQLNLEQCESLKALPESLSLLFRLDDLGLVGCKSLQSWPSSFAPDPPTTSYDSEPIDSPRQRPGLSQRLHVDLSSWRLLVNLVERFGHFSEMTVRFYMSCHKWEEMVKWNAALKAKDAEVLEWGHHIALKGESLVQAMEMMRQVHEVDDTNRVHPLDLSHGTPLFTLHVESSEQVDC